ncbi:MAG: alpha/beta hydrolase [Solobacterium sp.]|nr:alpha/beta hydrolase [Solobacterium sp.]
MSLKAEMMKKMIRFKRNQEVWKDTEGEAFRVKRENSDPVDVFLYRPKNTDTPYPVIFNIHGGGWVGCDASQLDSFCLDMTEKCGAFIVNINYTKLDVHPFPYPQNEIADTVKYFLDHSEDYHLDKEKFAVMGFSAGGHLAAASTRILHDQGIDLSVQVLCYPFLDFVKFNGLPDEKTMDVMKEVFFPEGVSADAPYISPVNAAKEQLKGIAPAVFVCCGMDPLTEHSQKYNELLKEAGVKTEFRTWEQAMHGFLEVNHKEYPDQDAKNPEQEAYAKEAEDYIAEEMKKIWRKTQ